MYSFTGQARSPSQHTFPYFHPSPPGRVHALRSTCTTRENEYAIVTHCGLDGLKSCTCNRCDGENKSNRKLINITWRVLHQKLLVMLMGACICAKDHLDRPNVGIHNLRWVIQMHGQVKINNRGKHHSMKRLQMIKMKTNLCQMPG